MLNNMTTIVENSTQYKIILTGDLNNLAEKIEFYYNQGTLIVTFFWQTATNSLKNHLNQRLAQALVDYMQLKMKNPKYDIEQATSLNYLSNEVNKIELPDFEDISQEGHFADNIHAHDTRMRSSRAHERYPHWHLVFKTTAPIETIEKILNFFNTFQYAIFNNKDRFQRFALIADFCQLLNEKYSPTAVHSSGRFLFSVEDCIAHIELTSEALDNEIELTDVKRQAQDEIKEIEKMASQLTIITIPNDIKNQIIDSLLSHSISVTTASQTKSDDSISRYTHSSFFKIGIAALVTTVTAAAVAYFTRNNPNP